MGGMYTIGVDVGGTNIKLGIVDSLGRVRYRTVLETKRYVRHKNRLIDALIHAVQELVRDNQIAWKEILGVGIGLPGLVDFQKGVVISITNIPGWRNVPLRDIVRKKLKVPVHIDNDVNLITLGEWKFGAGRGFRNLVCMTLGTGVGGGLIFNNALYRGEGFAAGEIGHIPINEQGPACGCGGYACLEHYVGNRTLLSKAAKIFKNKDIGLPDVYRLASQGNTRALEFWNEAASHLGSALTGLINLLNPRLIIIGGGVSNNLKFMRKTILRVINRRAMRVQKRMVKIVRARLGDDAGIIGAQVLIQDAL